MGPGGRLWVFFQGGAGEASAEMPFEKCGRELCGFSRKEGRCQSKGCRP